MAWWGERLAREKTLKSLSSYLEPEPPPAEKRAAGAAKVRALFERHAAKAAQPME